MKSLVAGVDIDGVTTRCALVDEFGKIYAKCGFPTTEYKEFKHYVVKLKEEIETLSNGLDIPHNITAIGIGAPNSNYYTGEIENAANLVWKGKLPIAENLSTLFEGKPVVVTNDANAAAIGEMIYGGAKGMKNFVVVIMGTGLGSGIVVDGNLLYGHDGFAGELGHIRIVKDGGRECGCGRKGCLEQYASIKGIQYTLKELMQNSSEPSKLRDIPDSELTPLDVAFAAKSGDVLAKKCFEITGDLLGYAISNLIAVTSPQAVFLSGAVGNIGELILTPTKRAIEKNVLPLWKGKIKVALSSLDYENAPILGAAALAIKEIEKKNIVVARRKVF